jgi:signal transduction histidine kinase
LDLGDAIYKNLASRQLVKAAEFGLESQRQDSILAAALGAGVLAAQPAAPVEVQKLEKFEVTGSRIKRIESETGATVSEPFTQEEEEILEMFAAQAAIAIENAQLYKENQQLAVLRERERIGMDLHDGIIQSLYAIGLLLDDARHRLDNDPEKARSGLGTAIAGLNNTIQDIRNYISDLRPHRFQGRNVKQGLEQLTQELRTDTLFAVRLNVDPQAAAACTARQANEFLHIAQEALANIRRHAEATTIQMRFQFSDGLLQMTIQDDGVGFEQAQARLSRGNGLRNMRERARALHGEFRSESRPGSGAQIVVTAPIEKREA